MRSALLAPVQDLLAEAEESLGRRVELKEDPALPVAGTTAVIPTRPNYGKVLISPAYRDCASYIVANQCSHILRYARAPPEYKLVPAERPGAYSFIHVHVQQFTNGRELLRRLPSTALNELTRLLLNGLVTQLTSMPADCRIDRALYRDIRELREEQRRALGKMLNGYVAALKTEDWTPPLVYRASNAMNAAFAQNVADLFPEADIHRRRYERGRFGADAAALMHHLDGEDEGYVSDTQTTDAWAAELRLRELYEWRHERELARVVRHAAR